MTGTTVPVRPPRRSSSSRARVSTSMASRLRYCLTIVPLASAAPRVAAAQADSARYTPVIARLDSLIRREMADKRLPGLSIALVDDQRVVWARGYGQARPARGGAPAVPMSAGTVHRVGSVSKLFTDIAVMQLVERGELDLDAPITRYLPDFAPADSAAGPNAASRITLRHLMSHRAGLVREPPAGHYFDSTGTSLAETVRSLGTTALVYAPGARSKYSNAAIATVGYVLERTQHAPFAEYVQRAVVRPMGLGTSSFTPEPAAAARLAQGVMWSYDGREWPAPTFELGEGPAGSLYTTVEDLGRFLGVLFAGGRGPAGQVIRPETLQAMWTPQFAPPDATTGYGIGFGIGKLDGHRRVAHGGAIYGFATELAALPDDKLGVAVVTTLDGANAVTSRIADDALRLLLAARDGRPLPVLASTAPLAPGRALRLAGRYGAGDAAFDLEEYHERLYASPQRGGFRVELRGASAHGDTLVVDDRLAYGARFVALGEGAALVVGRDTLRRVASSGPAASAPRPAPAAWRALVGEYGPDYDTLYLLERHGRLDVLIEWFFEYPLTELAPDVYAFPRAGLYDGERLTITRDAAGRVIGVVAGGVRFPRRAVGTADGSQFAITPVRPVAELRAEALAARPPVESGPFRASDLVSLPSLDPTIKLDVRYATANNFMRTPFYSSARAFMQRPAAEAVARASRSLRPLGYGLLVHDAYRPWYVTKMFWDGTPPAQHVFVADPSQGSRHNRGAAVDITLYDLRTGRPIEMTGGYDEMSDRSYPPYPGGTSLQRWHRDLLRRTMEAQGFTVYDAEWWHFDFGEWRQYPIGTKTFEELARDEPT